MNQNLILKVVENAKDFDAFVRFPFDLYRNNPYWVPPLIKEEIETINPKINPVYKNAKARFFLVLKGEDLFVLEA